MGSKSLDRSLGFGCQHKPESQPRVKEDFKHLTHCQTITHSHLENSEFLTTPGGLHDQDPGENQTPWGTSLGAESTHHLNRLGWAHQRDCSQSRSTRATGDSPSEQVSLDCIAQSSGHLTRWLCHESAWTQLLHYLQTTASRETPGL